MRLDIEIDRIFRGLASVVFLKYFYKTFLSPLIESTSEVKSVAILVGNSFHKLPQGSKFVAPKVLNLNDLGQLRKEMQTLYLRKLTSCDLRKLTRCKDEKDKDKMPSNTVLESLEVISKNDTSIWRRQEFYERVGVIWDFAVYSQSLVI